MHDISFEHQGQTVSAKSNRPIQSPAEHLLAKLGSFFMKIFFTAFCVLVVFPAFGQKPVEISIPDGCSWLLTGGGEGQDDAPAPFLPAVATIRNLSNDATIRIMDGTNTNQIRTYSLPGSNTSQVVVQRGERLLIDADAGPTEVTVAYDGIRMSQVLDGLAKQGRFIQCRPTPIQ